MKHDADESSFWNMRIKHPVLRRDTSRRQSRMEHFRRCLRSFATLDQTVSALKGDVPGGSLERLGEPSRYLTVVWNASMSEPRHPLCEGYYTRLGGLRRSLASGPATRCGKNRTKSRYRRRLGSRSRSSAWSTTNMICWKV